MKKNPDKPADATELRRLAEERLKRQAGEARRMEADAARLVHELEVHQIELEMQNEELQQARASVEALVAQYIDLYDFAPISYFSLDHEGAIRKANLSGARLLGVERSRLMTRRFATFVAESERPAFSAFLQKVFAGNAKEFCEVALPKGGDPPFFVRIEGTVSEDGQECRAAVLDFTEQKQAKEQLLATAAGTQRLLALSEQSRMALLSVAEDQKAAAEALRESEERFRSLTEMSSDFYWETDVEHRFTQHTSSDKHHPAALSRPRMQIGERRWEIPHSSPDEAGWQAHRAVLDAHRPFRNFEFSRLGTDGTEHHLSISGDPLFDASGAFKGYRGVGSNISERKRAEAARGQLAAIVETSNDAIISRALDGTILSWNVGAERMFGYTAVEAIGKSVTFNRLPGQQSKVAQNNERILRGETIAPHELQRVTKDGRAVDVLNSLSPVRDAAGKIIGASLILHDITERKRMEEALRATSEQLQTLVRSAPLAIFTRDKNRLVTSWNPAAEQIYGWKASEVLGKPITPGRTHEQFARAFAAVLAGAELVEQQIQRLRPDGARILLNVDMAPLRDASGNISGVITIASDISERKQAEEALHASEQRFRDIAEHAQEWIWEIDAEGKYTYVSRVVEKILGYTPEEMLQKHFYDLFHPDDRESFKAAALAAFAAKQPFREFINRNVHKNGQVVWLSTNGHPLLDEKGVLLGYRGADTDISERKQAEAARDQLAAIVENSNDAILSRTLDGTILSWNAGAERMFGYSATEAIGKPAIFNLRPGQQLYFAQNSERLLRGETIARSESQRMTKDGRVIDVVSTISPVRDDAGRIIGASVIFYDISERKRAEEQILRQVDELQRWQDVLLGREERVQELKREVNELCRRQGEAAHYPSEEVGPADAGAAKPNS